MKINKSLVRKTDGGATYSVPVRDASYDCRHCFQLGNGRTMPPPQTINTYIHEWMAVLPPRRRLCAKGTSDVDIARKATTKNDSRYFNNNYCIVRHADIVVSRRQGLYVASKLQLALSYPFRRTAQTMSVIFRRRFYRNSGRPITFGI